MDTNWLKSAKEHFREAMNSKNWDMAKATVADMREKGHNLTATLLETELWAGMPKSTHGYILGFLRKKNEEYKAKGLVPTLDLLIEDLTN